MDGEITIGTKLSTDKFDKQISDLEKKMKKEEDKKIVIDAKLGSQQEELDKARQKTDALADAYQRLKEVQDRLATKQATPKDFTTFQDLQNTYGSLEKLGSEFDKALTKQNAIEQKVTQTKYRYDEINAKVSEYKQKIENVKIQKQVADVEKLKQGFNNVGNSLESSIKKVARLALGIFGLRSAYMALRRASSDLANYDQQYATNLEYIRYALTQAVAPVLRYIVELAAKVLQYINMILNALFGINIFSRGSAESFNKMKAGAGGALKAVKEIKKQLAGFDEINMLTDQSNSGAGGGGGASGAIPDFDLSKMQGEPPAWLQWIIDHKNEILSVLAGIVTALALIHLGIKPLTALGIGTMVAGILWTIKALKDYLEAPTWENFGKIIQGIGIFLAGLLGIILGFPGVVIGVVVFIVGTIIKYWGQIKSFLQGGIDWLTSKSDWVHQMFGDTIGDIYDLFVDWLQDFLNFFDKQFQAAKKILDGIIEFVTGVFTGDWKKAWEGIKKIFSGLWDSFTSIVDFVLKTIIKSFQATGRIIDLLLETLWNIIISAAETVIKFISSIFSGLWESIKSGAQGTWDFIVRVFNGIGSFFSNIISNILGFFGNLGQRAGEIVSGAFKKAVNAVLGVIERILNSPIRAINRLIGVINAVPRNKLKYTTNI